MDRAGDGSAALESNAACALTFLPARLASPVPAFSLPACPAVSYMPPELLTDDELSPATDAFSLGVGLWELMNGRRAWRGWAPCRS